MSKEMGTAIAKGSKWNDAADIDKSDWEAVIRKIQKFCTDGATYQRELRKNPSAYSTVICCASDAMNSAWAGVELHTSEVTYGIFQEEEQAWHINWKETFSALKTLGWILLKIKKGTVNNCYWD
eukprot:GILI01054153.1.p1 GENE.GILI01054153.1~~GILI01054153.1.p1  ORF type:complete len:134 (+),score=19.59 GILI01054153.1:31-402(+)